MYRSNNAISLIVCLHVKETQSYNFSMMTVSVLQVFIILHVVALVYYIKGLLTPRLFKVAMTLVISVGL